MKRFKEWSEKPITRGNYLMLCAISSIAGLFIGLSYVWRIADIHERISGKLMTAKKKFFRRG